MLSVKFLIFYHFRESPCESPTSGARPDQVLDTKSSALSPVSDINKREPMEEDIQSSVNSDPDMYNEYGELVNTKSEKTKL